MPARAWGMIRTDLHTRIRATTASAIRTISAADGSVAASGAVSDIYSPFDTFRIVR